MGCNVKIKPQKGVALITVMLVFAVVSILAAALIKRLDQLINMTSHSVTQAQLRSYALGSEALIKYVLSQDKTPNVDALIEEDWSTYRGQPMQLEQYPIKEAYTRVWVIDAERCFNLNSLFRSNGGGTNDDKDDKETRNTLVEREDSEFGGMADSTDDDTENSTGRGSDQKKNNSQKQFNQLLNASKLPSALYTNLKDWVDSDQSVSSAEDYYYLGLKPPYRTANQLLYDFSELRQIKGFNQKVIDTLATTSCVLPGIDTFALNINTVSEALLKAIDPNKASKIIEQRKKKPIKDSSSFNSNGVNYQVRSSYFWVQVEVVLFGKRQVLSSLLHRKSKKEIDVISRQWLPLSAPLVISEQSKSS
ncbi:type II secretion system minor pseudopilin GspK [Zooshikella marina]|uniref:type II secretion system minor pseudopilin GspK n=1 Tax=Zooshikella ganghwensis TaxID=202772 RepID=UPI001BAE5B6A|nr:type II secretion system minor pseudopilin GspK [Zooshikella ganghwensis]MBU2706989.1 type II secretion system minor pseudopilin GspK [Zooshikella ganghwensis]